MFLPKPAPAFFAMDFLQAQHTAHGGSHAAARRRQLLALSACMMAGPEPSLAAAAAGSRAVLQLHAVLIDCQARPGQARPGQAPTHLSRTMQLMRLNSTTISPPSAHAAIGARQMLLDTNDRTVDCASFQVSMCRLPDAFARFVAVAQAMMTYMASTSCEDQHSGSSR
jgi:hypothetical protein